MPAPKPTRAVGSGRPPRCLPGQRAGDDDCRSLIGAGGADEAVAAAEQADQLLDERQVMGGDRVDALRREVLQRRGPGDEVEEVSCAEDVVGTGTEILAQAMFAFLVEIELGAVGQGKPVGLAVLFVSAAEG